MSEYAWYAVTARPNQTDKQPITIYNVCANSTERAIAKFAKDYQYYDDLTQYTILAKIAIAIPTNQQGLVARLEEVEERLERIQAKNEAINILTDAEWAASQRYQMKLMLEYTNLALERQRLNASLVEVDKQNRGGAK